jgi:hypothetical protein
MVVQLTVARLREVVADCVLETLADHEPQQRPSLLDQAALAREFGCSTRTILTLRKEGLPTIMLGDSPRFELAVALEWLRARGSQTAEPAGACESRPAVVPLDSHRRASVPAQGFLREPVASNDSDDLGGRG